MILCDPYAIHTICVSIMKCLQTCANTETIPRVSQTCHLTSSNLSWSVNVSVFLSYSFSKTSTYRTRLNERELEKGCTVFNQIKFWMPCDCIVVFSAQRGIGTSDADAVTGIECLGHC